MSEKEQFIFEHKIHFDNKWFGERFCSECSKKLTHYASKEYYVIRNIRNAKTNGETCLQCSTKGEKNPFFGKTHSDKTKKQVCKSRTGKACGINNSMNNPENRKKISVKLKEKYKNGDLDYLKKIQSDFATKCHSDGVFKTCPVSKIELEIGKKLSDSNINFKPQFKITSKPYDFYFPEKNLLVEFNGDYFYANPIKYEANYFNKKKNMFAYQLWEQDELKKKEALDGGYNFLTVWESEYKQDKNLEINKIINYGR